MKKMTKAFNGPLGSLIKRHLALHRSLGSLMNGAEHTLHHFDRYMRRYHPRVKTVTRAIITDYIESVSHLNSNSLHTTLTHLRKFCSFLFSLNSQTYIPERGLIPTAKRKVVPYIYTEQDLKCILNGAKNLEPSGSLRPLTYVTLISLLWVTGLRIHEALKLNLEDIDCQQAILYVRKTKFSKSRIVPLSPSTVSGLKKYFNKRAQWIKDQRPQSPLFINQRRQRCTYITVSYTFRQIIRKTGLKTPQGTSPRLHDIRHRFATNCLVQFYKDGYDPSAYLPVLATYLGHVNIQSTQVYLHPEINLLTMACEKFHQYAFNQDGAQ